MAAGPDVEPVVAELPDVDEKLAGWGPVPGQAALDDAEPEPQHGRLP